MESKLEFLSKALPSLRYEGIQKDTTSQYASLPLDDQPVCRPYNENLFIVFLVDTGETYTYVQNRDLNEAQCSVDDLYEVSLKNLSNLLRDNLRTHKTELITSFLLLPGFEASLILIDELWDNAIFDISSDDIVIAIPTRDVFSIGNKHSAQGIRLLQGSIRNLFGNENTTHFLSPHLYHRVNRMWQPFLPQPNQTPRSNSAKPTKTASTTTHARSAKTATNRTTPTEAPASSPFKITPLRVGIAAIFSILLWAALVGSIRKQAGECAEQASIKQLPTALAKTKALSQCLKNNSNAIANYYTASDRHLVDNIHNLPCRFVGTWQSAKGDGGRYISKVKLYEDGEYFAEGINHPSESRGSWAEYNNKLVWFDMNQLRWPPDINPIASESENEFTLIEVNGGKTLFKRQSKNACSH